MENRNQTSHTFEIHDYYGKETWLQSLKFLSGGCEWYLRIYPKGNGIDGNISLSLIAANPESLRLGWKRRANYSYLVLNQSYKVVYRLSDRSSLFCSQFIEWEHPTGLSHKKFLGKNKLIIILQVKVVEVVDQGDVTGKETLNLSGFQVPYSQVHSVSFLFAKYPDLAVNFRPTNLLEKRAYMNLLLGLIETLNKPLHSFSETELSNAQSELKELTEAGFKLDWLKKRLYKASLERKKTNSHDLKIELNKEKAKSACKVLSLEKKVSELKAELKKKKEKEEKSTSPKASSFKDVVCFWKSMSGTRLRRSGYEKLE